MGLPSLRTPEDGEDSEPSEAGVDAGKQTLFGLPMQKTEQFSLRRIIGEEESSQADDDDDDDDDRTFIMPAAHLNFDEDDAMRGTVAGRPVKRGIAAPGRPAVDDSTELGSVSGSAVFAASAKPGPPRHHGATLMGMSLEELEARREEEDDAEATREVSVDVMRATAFGVPAVQQDGEWAPRAQREKAAASDADEHTGDAGTVEDHPTQAWTPAASEPLLEDDTRRKLLARIRQSKASGSDTSRGLPAISPPTLDGPPRVHDGRRVYADGSGSYASGTSSYAARTPPVPSCPLRGGRR